MINTTRPIKVVEPRLFKERCVCGDVFAAEDDPDELLLVVFVIPGGDKVMVRPLDRDEKAHRAALPSLRFVGFLVEDGVLRVQAGAGWCR